jgi:hypothetical protein
MADYIEVPKDTAKEYFPNFCVYWEEPNNGWRIYEVRINEISNYKQMLVGVSRIYAVRRGFISKYGKNIILQWSNNRH